MLYECSEPDALTRLQELGFSPRTIERIFKPFFAGIFCEPDLAVSSRACEFVFRATALGDTTLPARGVGEIPAQLAAKLPPDSIRLRARVRQLLDEQVVLDNVERMRTPALVIATDAQRTGPLVRRADKKWKRLAVYRLPAALPRQAPPSPIPTTANFG